MIHTVYKTTNTLNGKYYIGVHSTDDLNDDYLGSGKYLVRAIKKYGREVFEKEIIAVYENREHAFILEKLLVDTDAAKDKLTYNTRAGGGGYPEPQPKKPKEPKDDIRKLKGNTRTERQILASRKHSSKMKGHQNNTLMETELFGVKYRSITSAMKSLGITYNTYCLIKNSEKQYQNLEEAKQDIWLNRSRKISQSKSGKKYNRNGYSQFT